MSKKIDTLWIPEKPSVAKELTAAIARVKKANVTNMATAAKDGFYSLSSGDTVCSVFGHMLQMLPPNRYLTKEQNANLMACLPLIPNPFKFEPQFERTKDGKIMMRDGKPVVSKRFSLLEKLIKQSAKIVNGCDIDREGQLIFDELIQYVGRDPYAKDIFRTSIVSMTPEALDEAVRNIEPNSAKKWLYRGNAAATRQKMDWLLGMNASMAYQVVTGIRKMSVGRVQTPVLAMVVRRDLEIENFKPQVYYVPVVIMKDGTRLRWERRQDAQGSPGFDANGRIIDHALAQAIVNQIQSGLPGNVIVAKQDEKREAPPLPFSMGSLQSEASKRHGLTVAEVTSAAQSLYERHKAITYVGTDCRFLPEKMHADAQGILQGLGSHLKVQAAGANPSLKSKAFNDNKIDEHFAIVPTGRIPNLGANDHAERLVYETIALRYIAQFYPDARTRTATLSIEFGKDEFRASASEPIELGWKHVEGQSAEKDGSKDDGNEDRDEHNHRSTEKET